MGTEEKSVYRIDLFLDAIINGTTPPTPQYRIEYYLARIAGENVTIPEPIYRTEYYLAKIAGMNVVTPKPIYRIEHYLSAICGDIGEIPEPQYHIEHWLALWATKKGAKIVSNMD